MGTEEQGCVMYAVSDRSGETATRVVRGASAQFGKGRVQIKVLQRVQSAQQVIDFIEGQGDAIRPTAVFHTVLSKRMREDLRAALATMRIPAVDLIGSTCQVMSSLLGEEAQDTPGLTIGDGAEPVLFDLG